MSKHILRFRLGGCELDTMDYNGNNILVAKRDGTAFIFGLSLDKGTWGGSINNDIVTVINTEAFTVTVLRPNNMDFGILFDSQPEDVYGDNYSMDISDVSVLDFSNYSYIGLYDLNRGIDGLTLKLYKASITNSGIGLSAETGTISNTSVTVTDCNMNSGEICISVGVYKGNINNVTNIGVTITVTDCNINTSGNTMIGVLGNMEIGVYGGIGGTTSNSSVTVTGCNIHSNNDASIYCDTYYNNGTVTNSTVAISNTTVEYKTDYECIYPEYINNTTLSLDNVVVIKK